MSVDAGLELVTSRRAFPTAQSLLAGAPVERVSELTQVGWHGTDVHEESGSVALARSGGPYAELVGEILSFRSRRGTVYAYCVASGNVPTDLSLTRRAFFALAALSEESVPCAVTVVG